MTNPHGSFIWYELMTTDADAAGKFYHDVIGWDIADSDLQDKPYAILSMSGTGIGGLMPLPPGAEQSGMHPGWFGYIGVEDVDTSVNDIVAAGGKVHMPATDIPDVGRLALVADPQGVIFYVMRGANDETSTAFKPMANGHCGWNELVTSDQAAALAFYTDQFGWTKGDVMPMGPMGDYQFINHGFIDNGGGMIGAMMTRPEGGPPPMWHYYFRVVDIDVAASTATDGGGRIMFGPIEVPGGDFVIEATDPQGAMFGLVGPRQNKGE